MSGWAILSVACLLAGLGVALWGYEAHQRLQQQMARHLQTVLEQREGTAVLLGPVVVTLTRQLIKPVG